LVTPKKGLPNIDPKTQQEVKYIVDLDAVITKTNIVKTLASKPGELPTVEVVKEALKDLNPTLDTNYIDVNFVDGKLGKIIVAPKDFNTKTLYFGGPIEITYKVNGDSVISNVDMTEYPLSHLPKTDKGKELGKTLTDHNPNFEPTD